MSQLTQTIQALLAGNKGLLAMDESTHTCNKRFADLGIPQTLEMRRAWRELLITAPRLGDSISGVILFDETIRQQTRTGQSFIDVLVKAGIVPGIKVDMGAKPLAGFPGETITEGLDGLRNRLTEYRDLGARFAKWRAVVGIGPANGETLPTSACIEANVQALARYAALCQEVGLVPIVEPEVLMDGNHTIDTCAAVTQTLLTRLFAELATQRVSLETLLLKPNMVLAGKDCPDQPTIEEVADATIMCLLRTVPPAIPGIAFLSGGQSPEQATERLRAMHRSGLSAGAAPVWVSDQLPWVVTFSFSRAVQQPALAIWRGDAANTEASQQSLLTRTEANAAARRGQVNAETISLS
jgi:fructose-bisphosphate aldolase, class I